MAKLSIIALFAAWAASQGALAAPRSSSSVPNTTKGQAANPRAVPSPSTGSLSPLPLVPARRGASPDIDSVPIPVPWPLAAREDDTATSSSSSSWNFDQIKANQGYLLRTYTTTMTSTTINVTSTTSSKTSAPTSAASGSSSGYSVPLTSEGPISSDTLSIGLIGTVLGLLIGIVMFVL